jgi:transcriptional regulator with XRE-family HTH domain
MSESTDPPRAPVPDAEAGMRARFGENVRLLRAHTHISQEELAARADVHRTQISMFESGQRVPLLGTAIKLAAALQVEMGTLLDGIAYRPQFFSAERGKFEISPHPLFELSGPERQRDRGSSR